MEQIGQIVKLISEISDQTNLLALNAAIEAARAGDAGRGFAVVAEEVKSLAVESQNSAEKIAAMIQTLQKQSDNAMKAMHRSSDEVSAGNTAVNATLNVFSDIIVHIQEISENTSSVAAAAQEQAAAVEEITASVHELENQVTKTSDEALESAAATEQTSAALNQISHSVSQVANAADHINREMGRFIV
jgi:methyl-accepting chemotaxis protein